VDIEVVRVTVPGAINNGQIFSMSVVVRNNGKDPVGPFPVRFSLPLGSTKVRPVNVAVDGVLGKAEEIQVPGLGAGQTTTVNIPAAVFHWVNIHNTYSIVAIADPDDTIQETNTENNMATSRMFTVSR
jgi:hypothetical protein